MRKCGFHVQQTSPKLREAILAVKPTVIASLAHDRDFWWGVKQDLPEVFLIGRRYEDDLDWRVVDPWWWAAQCAALEMPYDAFITWNEPTDVYNGMSFDLAARHDDWCCLFRNRAKQLGYEAVALNVPTGHFHRNAVVNLFPNTCQEFEYIGLHEYSARAMWDQDPKKQRPPEKIPRNEGDLIGHWYCQRYRDWHDGIVARWPEREGKFQVVVTECGVAYGVMPGFGDVGWQTDLSPDQYLESLRWYFGEMNRDDYCLGGAIFMMGFADHKWASFETLPLWERLLEIPETGDAPPAPPPSPDEPEEDMTIKIYDFDHGPGDAETVDWQWIHDTFGDVQVRAIEDKEGLTLQEGDVVYKLAYLDARLGDANIIINVRDVDGVPVQGETVMFGWPDAPSHNYTHKPSNWTATGVPGEANEKGDVGPGLGPGAYYSPDKGERGAHFVWVYGRPSDYVDGLGMLGMTNHAHLNVGYRAVVVAGDEEPPPGPTEGKFVEVSRAFQEEGNNRILVIAQGGVDFYETRASIRVKGTDVDMGPFHPETLTKYALTVDYIPVEGEESRVFVVTIERPDGEVVSDPLEFPYQTGELGWWTSLVEWREAGPQPPPDDVDAIHQAMAVAHSEIAKAHAVLAECHAKLAKY